MSNHQALRSTHSPTLLIKPDGQHFVAGELLQRKAVVIAGYMNAVGSVKAAVSYDDVAMGVEAEETTEGLETP